jgi:N-acetylglucosamine kinase-like BadF-type ATPase
VALVAGVGDAPGVVIVCGTGSIAYGRDRAARAARAGGWGHILGDEGSGYWIGRHALRAVARAADGRGPATALTDRVLNHFAVAGPSDLIREVYERDLRHHAVAQLARVVQQARDEGDELATQILERAAHELVGAARSVVDRLEMCPGSGRSCGAGYPRSLPGDTCGASRSSPPSAPFAWPSPPPPRRSASPRTWRSHGLRRPNW